MPAESPLWRQVFDGVERRVGVPLTSVTSSTEFRVAAMRARSLRRAVVAPVQAVTSFGLHLLGLPSHTEVREVRRELNAVQREVSAMRRDEEARKRQRPEP